jgi:hypothetical protein
MKVQSGYRGQLGAALPFRLNETGGAMRKAHGIDGWIVSRGPLLLLIVLMLMRQGNCIAQQDGSRGQNGDALRKAHIERLFQDIDKYKAQGRYDQVIRAVEGILEVSVIPDKKGNRNAEAASRAWREMEAAHGSIEATIDGMLREFESGQLSRIKSVLEAFDQRAGRPDVRIAFDMSDESESINRTLPQVFQGLERCLAAFPVIGLCRPDIGSEGGQQQAIESATERARIAVDAACTTESADKARKSTADIERAKAIVGSFSEKVAAWSSRGAKGSQIVCGGATIDLKDFEIVPPEFDRKAAEYESRLGQLRQSQDAMRAELDGALSIAQSALDEMRRRWQSREVAALLSAHRQAEEHIKASGNQGKWAKRSQELLREGQAEIARIQSRLKSVSGEDVQDHLRRIGQMRQKIEELKNSKQRMQDQMACADRISAMYPARAGEVEQLLDRSRQCLQIVEAKEAAERAAAQQRLAMQEARTPAPSQPDTAQPAGRAVSGPVEESGNEPGPNDRKVAGNSDTRFESRGTPAGTSAGGAAQPATQASGPPDGPVQREAGSQSPARQTAMQPQEQTAEEKTDKPGGDASQPTAQTPPPSDQPPQPQQPRQPPVQVSPRTDGYYRSARPADKLFYLRFVGNGVARAAYYFPLAGSEGTGKLGDVMPGGRFDGVDRMGISLLAAPRFDGYRGVSFDREYHQRGDSLVMDMKKRIRDPNFYDFVELRLEDGGRALTGTGRRSEGNASLHLVFVPYGWNR